MFQVYPFFRRDGAKTHYKSTYRFYRGNERCTKSSVLKVWTEVANDESKPDSINEAVYIIISMYWHPCTILELIKPYEDISNSLLFTCKNVHINKGILLKRWHQYLFIPGGSLRCKVFFPVSETCLI